ncbi:MAG: hypothetical protein M0C28_31720 [Candidatus Moduliflexus flocculans]|nr:hypothetical protein [Candidatus Moduliflexus flocculans]
MPAATRRWMCQVLIQLLHHYKPMALSSRAGFTSGRSRPTRDLAQAMHDVTDEPPASPVILVHAGLQAGTGIPGHRGVIIRDAEAGISQKKHPRLRRPGRCPAGLIGHVSDLALRSDGMVEVGLVLQMICRKEVCTHGDRNDATAVRQ